MENIFFEVEAPSSIWKALDWLLIGSSYKNDEIVGCNLIPSLYYVFHGSTTKILKEQYLCTVYILILYNLCELICHV